ncbi:hypothetical protein PITCH_A350057 [uncultured Desulfobacterium sp.]|uniref:Uncharacterized protein n=1 Tax=uncultured Desulfobacterium sp. TaxID=201089 RepID=A0A445MZC8_9BACT|nr:hypothetical protein PITCH_A350057 [uncultured Desulfobacterium sp.]
MPGIGQAKGAFSLFASPMTTDAKAATHDFNRRKAEKTIIARQLNALTLLRKRCA